jgi:hypothetical protein
MVQGVRRFEDVLCANGRAETVSAKALTDSHSVAGVTTNQEGFLRLHRHRAVCDIMRHAAG